MTLGNPHFLFFDTRNAEAITSTGQVAIKFIGNKLNEFMKRIIGEDVDTLLYMDTDSAYIEFSPVVEKYFPGKSESEITDLLDKIAKEKIQPFIAKAYDELADYLNAFNMEWFMKREAIASEVIFVQKKRYFMSLLDDEGVRMKEPKIKVTGLEAVRSSTPEICRNSLKGIMKTILRKDEESLQKEVETFRKEFYKAHILDICFPRGVSDIEKWLDSKGMPKKGTPIGARGAIVFNNYMKKIDPTFETIKSGDKVKFCYLKEPNVLRSNVIAFPNALPDQLSFVSKLVDKNLQFEKTFIHPIENMLEVMGWSTEKKNTLESFFG